MKNLCLDIIIQNIPKKVKKKCGCLPICETAAA